MIEAEENAHVKTIKFKTSIEKETVVFRWKIKDFLLLRQLVIARCEYESPADMEVSRFSLLSPVYVDKKGYEWWLRFYVYENRFDQIGDCSLFIHTDRTVHETVIINFNVEVLDRYLMPIEGCTAAIKMQALHKQSTLSNIGLGDLILREKIESGGANLDEIIVVCELIIHQLHNDFNNRER